MSITLSFVILTTKSFNERHWDANAVESRVGASEVTVGALLEGDDTGLVESLMGRRNTNVMVTSELSLVKYIFTTTQNEDLRSPFLGWTFS